ncbi:hypothetical protein [Microbulbifer marinus]|uniref:Uncharacterized protein n=1 Tax=Microbulbifer marinus TaxID=658218 RepID=A0A1H4AM85_9GAMM|nr:hypothetical protein [Microbulbifer marinus]SEA36975.1 hypothetical protein SAMN05216562_2876 [Microbulbifer marinus]
MKHSALVFALTGGLSIGAQGMETLHIEIVTPDGHRYRAEQSLDKDFDSYQSGAIAGDRAPREYQAIRCGGPWGAIKYRLSLTSGPGYELYAKGSNLLLQIVEHSVISADQTIAAMSVHCIDTEPQQVLKAVAEIKLDRGSATTQQLRLANGYQLEYRYTP